MIGYVFFSHSSVDREQANRLVAEFERRGIPCWISSRDIDPGEDYQRAIVDALSRASAMLLLFSTNANTSKEIAKELALASAERKPVIPARIEDILPTGSLKYQLTNAQFIDLFNNYNANLERLCAVLRLQISKAPVPTKIPSDEHLGASTQAPVPAFTQSEKRIRRGRWLASTAILAALVMGTATWRFWPSLHADRPNSAHEIARPTSPPLVPSPLPPAVDLSALAPPSPAAAFELRPILKPIPTLEMPRPLPSVTSTDAPEPAGSAAISPEQSALTRIGPARIHEAGSVLISPPALPTTSTNLVTALGDVRGTDRADRLAVLLNSREITGPLPASVVLALLGDIPTNSGRRGDLLRRLAPLLARPLPPADAERLLAAFQGAGRYRALLDLEPCLAHPVPEQSARRLVDGVDQVSVQLLLRRLRDTQVASGGCGIQSE